MKSTGAGVSNFAAGELNLEEAGTLNGDIERIASLIEVALLLDDFRSSGARAEADLQAGGKRGLLGGGGAGSDKILVNKILKLQAAATVATDPYKILSRSTAPRVSPCACS